jgi:hypothetical protein
MVRIIFFYDFLLTPAFLFCRIFRKSLFLLPETGRRISVFLAVLLLTCGTLHAQVEFTALPGDLELVPRDLSGYGNFTVSGHCTNSSFKGLSVEIYNSTKQKLITTTDVNLDTGRTFEIPLKIKAELSEYEIRIFSVEDPGPRNLIKVVKGVVAGDIFVLAGQSNAVANAGSDDVGRHLDSLYQHFCCRTIGTDFGIELMLDLPIEATRFRRPSSGGWTDLLYGFVGIWALKLQHDQAIATGIPNCIVNSSQGATSISVHLASRTPSDPSLLLYANSNHAGHKPRLYDRLYKKLSYYRVEDDLKAIFWYQGESDGMSPLSLEYPQRFDTLYRSWKSDYQNLEHIFVLQINTGCDCNDMSRLRNHQAEFGTAYSDITVLSTVGSPASDRAEDGCHYTINGYLNIAEKLLGPARKLLYNHDLQDETIFPARIVHANYLSDKILCLEFDKNVFVQRSAHYVIPTNAEAFLTDYFYDENQKKLEIGRIETDGHKIFLYSDKPVRTRSITYLPDCFTEIPSIYTGPWILNAANQKIGALSFYKFPVEGLYEKNDFWIFPNPSAGNFMIANKNQKEIYAGEIYNSEGSKIADLPVLSTGSGIPIQGLTTGVYIIVLRHAGGADHFKIVVL